MLTIRCTLAAHAESPFPEDGFRSYPGARPIDFSGNTDASDPATRHALALGLAILRAQRAEQTRCDRCSRLAVGIDARGVAFCDAHIG